MDRTTINNTLFSIIKTVTNNKYDWNTYENEGEKILYYIISESIRATNFVLIIEDEFEIEFDDDDIDLSFFSSINYIIDLIESYKKLPQQT